MNVLYISQYFPPEVCAPAVRVYEFARDWQRAGHAVRVLTGFPNHPEGVLSPGYRLLWMRGFRHESCEGIDVRRTWLIPAANRGFRGRIANYVSFALSASVAGPFVAPRPGVVIATSPQLLVGAAGWWVSRARGLPFVFEVRDLWPESIEAVGAARMHSRFYTGLDHLARFLYGHADRIVLDGEAKRSRLIAAGVPAEKTAVIRNGVAPDFCFEPDSPAARAARDDVRKRLGLDCQFVVAYIGTLGMAHGLETILLAADQLRNFPEITFLLIGEGAEGERLRSKSRDLRLNNVRFLGKRERREIPSLLSAADACLVPLREKPVFRTAIPSKLFEAMAAGKPVILGAEGEAREIMTTAGAGIAVQPEDAVEFAEAILRLYRDRQLARTLGAKGRRAVIEKYSRSEQSRAYLDLLAELALQGRRTRHANAGTSAKEPSLAAASQILKRQNT